MYEGTPYRVRGLEPHPKIFQLEKTGPHTNYNEYPQYVRLVHQLQALASDIPQYPTPFNVTPPESALFVQEITFADFLKHIHFDESVRGAWNDAGPITRISVPARMNRFNRIEIYLIDLHDSHPLSCAGAMQNRVWMAYPRGPERPTLARIHADLIFRGHLLSHEVRHVRQFDSDINAPTPDLLCITEYINSSPEVDARVAELIHSLHAVLDDTDGTEDSARYRHAVAALMRDASLPPREKLARVLAECQITTPTAQLLRYPVSELSQENAVLMSTLVVQHLTSLQL